MPLHLGKDIYAFILSPPKLEVTSTKTSYIIDIYAVSRSQNQSDVKFVISGLPQADTAALHFSSELSTSCSKELRA